MTRDEATAAIEAAGGKVTDSVSRNTSYLVCGDEPGSKVDRAKALSVPIIDEGKLEKLLRG